MAEQWDSNKTYETDHEGEEVMRQIQVAAAQGPCLFATPPASTAIPLASRAVPIALPASVPAVVPAASGTSPCLCSLAPPAMAAVPATRIQGPLALPWRAAPAQVAPTAVRRLMSQQRSRFRYHCLSRAVPVVEEKVRRLAIAGCEPPVVEHR